MAAPKGWPKRTLNFRNDLVRFIFNKWFRPYRAADIMDRDIETSERLPNLLKKCPGTALLFQIMDGAMGTPAFCPDRFDDIFGRSGGAICHDDLPALMGAPFGC